MKLRIAVVVLVAALAPGARADQAVQNVQQALKDQGFYYGEVTGEKDADTTAEIRRSRDRKSVPDSSAGCAGNFGFARPTARKFGSDKPFDWPAVPGTAARSIR